jgi:CheY-like chemotaxis protein
LYLALSQGQIIFSGKQPLTEKSLLEIFQRYLPRSCSDNAKAILSSLQQQSTLEQRVADPFLLSNLLDKLRKCNLILNLQEIEQALRLKTLSDFDTYLFAYSGQARFLSSPQLQLQLPIVGFEIEDLLSESTVRRLSWNKLKTQVPSMDGSPVLTQKSIYSQQLTAEQRQRLEMLISSGKTLQDIAIALAQDELEIAKVFAKLISEGLVKLKTHSTVPEIFVVDDSAILLKQFERLVTSWGYSVKSFDHPADAMQNLLYSNPAAIFVDINMPSISGFDLVKQIRRCPELASVPLIMLTAEKTLSNNWRSRWSGCRFLTKPLTVDESISFQLELRNLLLECTTIEKQNQSVGSSTSSFEETYRWKMV